ncbi:MAG TPA: prepilin peptidase [Patescibacteria group bacterium]|nr:prepilin peptidase [Patescibacteria group bacterium]
MNFEPITAFIVFMSFLIGSCLGSFTNVVIDRLPAGVGLVYGRSYCEKCKKTLLPQDLVPIFSYLLLGGKCRFCKEKIPARLFYVEALIGLSLATISYFFLNGLVPLYQAIYIFIIIDLSTAIFFTDIEYGIIPDQLVIIATVLIFIYNLVYTPQLLVGNVLAGISAAIVFLILFLVTSGKGMGFGDVKLSFVLGLFLGFPRVVVGVYLAFLTGALISIILILLGKKKLKRDTIPFGPFLVMGMLIAFLFGNFLIEKALFYF